MYYYCSQKGNRSPYPHPSFLPSFLPSSLPPSCLSLSLLFKSVQLQAAFTEYKFLKFHYLHTAFFQDFIYFIFRHKGREGETEGETINVWLPLTHPLLGTWPTTQAHPLTGNPTGNPFVHRLALNPLSHTSQCCVLLTNCYEWPLL